MQEKLEKGNHLLKSGTFNDRCRELELKLINLGEQNRQKDFDNDKLLAQLKEKDQDMSTLAETFESEYEKLRLENERNVHEL